MAELDLLDEIFGGDFVERWLKWNGFEDELREWRSKAPLLQPQLLHQLIEPGVLPVRIGRRVD